MARASISVAILLQVALNACSTAATPSPEEYATLQAIAYRDQSHGGIAPVGDQPPDLEGARQKQLEIEQDRRVRAAASPPAPFVTAGGVSQPFEALGEVHFDTVGMINFGTALSDALSKSKVERAVGGATPELSQDRAFQELLKTAVAVYASAVSAVINATYRAEHNGNVFADGLAVRFVAPAASSAATASTTAQRLEELDGLLKKKLVSQKEYDQKRAEILREL